MGLAPLMLFTTSLLAVYNQRILHAWNARQEQKNAGAAAAFETANAAAKHSPASPRLHKPAPATHELPHECPYLGGDGPRLVLAGSTRCPRSTSPSSAH